MNYILWMQEWFAILAPGVVMLAGLAAFFGLWVNREKVKDYKLFPGWKEWKEREKKLMHKGEN